MKRPLDYFAFLRNNWGMRLSKKNQPGPVSEVFKALGHPARVIIIRCLSEREHCVCDLVEAVGLGWSTVSRHLSVLKQAGVITDDKRGLQVYYQLALPCVSRFIACLDNPEAQPEWMHTGCSCG